MYERTTESSLALKARGSPTPCRLEVDQMKNRHFRGNTSKPNAHDRFNTISSEQFDRA